MRQIINEEEINNPNNVKVVTDEQNFAMYFSRSPIPYPREKSTAVYYKHIGIYAFRKEALLKFTKLESILFCCIGINNIFTSSTTIY